MELLHGYTSEKLVSIKIIRYIKILRGLWKRHFAQRIEIRKKTSSDVNPLIRYDQTDLPSLHEILFIVESLFLKYRKILTTFKHFYKSNRKFCLVH